MISRLFAGILVGSVLLLAGPCLARPAMGDVANRLNQLSPTDRTVFLNDLAEKGVVLAESEYPSAIDQVTTGKALNLYMDFFSEPLSDACLDRLEQLVASDKDEAARFRAATLLYRHGRQAGAAYLEDAFDNHDDARSAEVFAMSRHPGSEAKVVSIVNEIDPIEARSIARLLIGWQSASLRNALVDAVGQPDTKIGWSNTELVASLSGNVPQSVLDLVRQRFTTLEAGDTARLEAAATLRRIDPSETEARNYLHQELLSSSSRFPMFKRWVIKAIASTGESLWHDDLNTAISQNLQVPENESRDGAINRLSAAVAAMDALRTLGGPILVESATAIYDQIESSHASFVRQRFERVLLQTENQSLVDLVEAHHGASETDRIKSIVTMKPVPRRYLPKSSVEWCPE